MSYIKAALATLGMVICGLLALIFFTFDTDYQYDQAMEAFQKGQCEEAKRCLTQVKDKGQSAQGLLYSAYLHRQEGDPVAANTALQKAWQTALAQKAPAALKMEIALNQAFNAECAGDINALSKALEKADSLSVNNVYEGIFQSIVALNEDKPQEALELLGDEPYMGEKKELEAAALSGWMKSSFTQHFSLLWKTEQRARAYLALGDTLTARKLLEKESLKHSEEEIPQLCFLLGLTYVREGQERPLSARSSYLKLALGYFDKVPIHQEQFKADRSEVLKQLETVGKELIRSGHSEELTPYVRCLRQWNAKTEVEELGSALVHSVKQAISKDDWDRVRNQGKILSQLFPSSGKEEDIETALEQNFANKLESASLEEITSSWDTLYSFVSHPKAVRSRTAALVRKRAISQIPKDKENLIRVGTFATFWSQLEPNASERLAFAEELLKASGRYWQRPGEEARASALMHLAAKLPLLSEKERFHEQLHKTFELAYKHCIAKDVPSTLSKLYATMAHFQLADHELKDRGEVANQVADAYQLLRQGKLEEAEKRIQLALTLDRENEEALRLHGLIRFQLRDYRASIELLEARANDPEASEALLVSRILSGDSTIGFSHVEDKHKHNPISDDALQHLAMQLLIQQRFEFARQCFEKQKELNWEAQVGLLVSSYQLQDWVAVDRSYRELPSPQNAWLGLRLMLVKSLAEKGELSLAENILVSCLKTKTEDNKRLCLSAEMQEVKRSIIDRQHPLYFAGIFYRDYLKDYQTALELFREGPNEQAEVLLAIGETQLLLGHEEEAIKPLEKLIGLDDCPQKQRAYLLLAHTYEKQNLLYHAARAYRHYFRGAPHDESYRPAFVKLLSTLGCWDEASEHFRQVKIAGLLDLDLVAQYIECLLNNDQKKRALALLRTFKAKVRRASPEQRLPFARVALLSGSEDFARELLAGQPSPISFSSHARLSYLRLALVQADYANAMEWADRWASGLEQSCEGLMLLAQLEQRMSRDHQALSHVYRVLELQPLHKEAHDFLFKHEQNSPSCETRLTHLKKAGLTTKADPYLGLMFNQQLLLYVQERERVGEISRESYLSALRNILSQVEEMIQAFPDYPLPHVLKGQTLERLGETKEARRAYDIALSWDRSNCEALLGVARAQAELGEKEVAKKTLEQALLYHPDDAELWGALASLCQNTVDWLQAREALEKAVRYRPRDGKLLVSLGQLLMRIQNPEQARIYLRQAVELEPENEEACCLLMSSLYHELSSLSAMGEKYERLEEDRRDAYRKLFSLNPDKARDMLIKLRRQSAE